MSNPGHTQDPPARLAHRLRSLREERRITQQQLALALGVSVPLISSWESQLRPRVPPVSRVDSYASLFATERSFDTDPPQLISADELTEEEQAATAELKTELTNLLAAAMEAGSDPRPASSRSPVVESINQTPWRFTGTHDAFIVCARLPQPMLDRMPYTDVNDPDYIETLTYSELDSLFELWGHIRAANPASHIYRRHADNLRRGELQGHLAILGGVDWNGLTRTMLEKLVLPVRQVADWDTEGEQYFEVEAGGVKEQYRPVLHKSGDQVILDEDVALFVRAVNPFNRERTVTLCHGMYGRGTYGAVRAFTDYNFRDRNSEYVKERFKGSEAYCILSRVPIVHGETLTPDWTTGEHTLFEWSR